MEWRQVTKEISKSAKVRRHKHELPDLMSSSTTWFSMSVLLLLHKNFNDFFRFQKKIAHETPLPLNKNQFKNLLWTLDSFLRRNYRIISFDIFIVSKVDICYAFNIISLNKSKAFQETIKNLQRSNS